MTFSTVRGSSSGDILDLGTDIGIIDKAGSWYSYMGSSWPRSRAISELLEDAELTKHRRTHSIVWVDSTSGEEPAALWLPAASTEKEKLV